MSRNYIELTEAQSKLFLLIGRNDIDGFKQLLPQIKGGVNYVDDGGMTPLQHACCKGKTEVVQLLLDMGADVHFNKHGGNYTPLHFAALSGNTKVCRMILDAGVDPSLTNSVSRTASQMAAFVGNHACVETINNYVPRSRLECFTRAQGKKHNEPLIPPEKLQDFHLFVSDSNLHPVRIVLNLQSLGLLKNLSGIQSALQSMCLEEMNKSNDINELWAFKFHYLGWIVLQLVRCDEQFKVQRKEKESTTAGDTETNVPKNDYVELFIKRVLKEGKQGHLEFVEFTIRECVREFPYRECAIFRQIVTQLAAKDSQPAFFVLRHAINGQRSFLDDISYCSTCGNDNPDKKCSKCKVVQYCDRECQRLHWFMHKKSCDRPNALTTNVNVNKPSIDVKELQQEIAKLASK